MFRGDSACARTITASSWISRSSTILNANWNPNVYELDGLVDRRQKPQPEVAQEKEGRKAARRRVETLAEKRGD